jgi:hypothetical protein
MIAELNAGVKSWLEGLGYNVATLGDWNSKTYPCIIIGDNITNQRAKKDSPYLEVRTTLHIWTKDEVEVIYDDLINNMYDIVIGELGVNVSVVNINTIIEAQLKHGVFILKLLIL